MLPLTPYPLHVSAALQAYSHLRPVLLLLLPLLPQAPAPPSLTACGGRWLPRPSTLRCAS
jgi:hypothetical protein